MLTGIVAVALAVRVAYAFVVAPDIAFLDDDTYYHVTANALADGHGYVRPIELIQGRELPSAEHPPLYSGLLAVVSLLGGTSVDAHRSVGIVAGTLTVLLVALVARRLAGDRAALAAAAVAALFPAFVAADGSLMSEPLLGTLMAGTLLVALRARERPTIRTLIALGALVALCGLARTEALLLLPLLVAAVVWRAPDRRLALGAVSAVAALLVLAPWVVRNWSTFDRPLISTNDGTTLAGGNCDRTYHGDDLGWFVFACALEPRDATGDEAERSARLRERGLDYIGEHKGRAVVVAGVRVLGLWGLFRPARHNVVTGRDVTVQKLGVIAFYPIALLALLGLWRIRRTPHLAIMLAPLLAATLAAAVTYGGPRLRHGADVAVVALAGAGVATLVERRVRAA
jgi:hypothetical protein